MSDAKNFEKFLYAVLTQLNRIIGEGSWKSEIENSLKDLTILAQPIWVRSSFNVEVGQTIVVDEISKEDFKSLKYFITGSKNNIASMRELSVIKQGNSIDHSIHGRIGSGIAFSIDTSETTEDFQITVKNNDSQTISLQILRAIGFKTQ